MLEGRNFRIALISGGFSQWSDSITPFLLTQTDCLDIVETADELLSTVPAARPEMIIICHCPGVYDGINAADHIRKVFPVTPLVLIAIENIETLKAALAIGALSILEPPFAKHAVEAACNRCRFFAGALKEEVLMRQSKELFRDGSTLSDPENFTFPAQLESTPFVFGNELPDPVPLAEVNLPPTLTTKAPDTISAAARTTASLSSLKILVAEDVPMLQTAIKSILEGIGCQYVVVGNGKEALDELENGGFDVILMDLRMPVMDGFEATRLIRARELTIGARTPIVALSSYSLREIIDKCLEIGMDSYLVKPVNRKKLEETLRLLINPQKVTDESVAADLNKLPVLETRAVLENLDFSLELYQELIGIYRATCAGLGDELAEILAGDNLKDIRTSAHSLKGIVSSIGGKRLEEVTSQIQNMCHEGKKPAVSVWAALVKAESSALNAAIASINWEAMRKFVKENKP